jgi:hypothetical protein
MFIAESRSCSCRHSRTFSSADAFWNVLADVSIAVSIIITLSRIQSRQELRLQVTLIGFLMACTVFKDSMVVFASQNVMDGHLKKQKAPAQKRPAGKGST